MPDDDGWYGGLYEPSSWRHDGVELSTTGLHCLLRAANLPLEELLHMGAPRRLLSCRAPASWPLVPARNLLGRIAWDAREGSSGQVWSGETWQLEPARELGARVIAEWFTTC